MQLTSTDMVPDVPKFCMIESKSVSAYRSEDLGAIISLIPKSIFASPYTRKKRSFPSNFFHPVPESLNAMLPPEYTSSIESLQKYPFGRFLVLLATIQ